MIRMGTDFQPRYLKLKDLFFMPEVFRVYLPSVRRGKVFSKQQQKFKTAGELLLM